MKRSPALLLLAACSVLLFSHRISAQQLASLSGTVLDPSGAAVAGAEVRIEGRSAGATPAHATSDSSGRFEIELPPGSYRLRITRASFVAYEMEIRLSAAERRDVTVRLSLDATSSKVIVTAVPLPQPAESVAAPVDVITEQDISQRQFISTAYALSFLQGASIGQGGRAGGPVSLFLDGGNSDYTKVLVDGVPLDTPGGAVDFSPFTLDNIAKVEVVHGAESVTYGSDAMTGVVQMISARGSTEQPALDLVAEGGNFSSARGAATLSGVAGRFDYLAGFSRSDTEGQGVNDAFRNATVSGNFGWKFTDADSIRLALRNNTSEAGIQGQTLITPPELNEYNALHDFSAALSGDFASGNHWRYHVLVAETYLRQRYENPLSSYYLSPDPFDLCTGMPRSPRAVPSPDFCDYTFSAFNQYNRVNAEAQASYVWARGSVTSGYVNEVENGWLSDLGGHARRNNQAGYLEARYQFGARLTATAGVRAEDNDSFGTRVVPRFGLSYLARQGTSAFGATRLHVSWGEGIKEPSFDQSFGTDPCFPGNPDLRPETSSSMHAGVDQYFASDRLHVSLDGFYNRFRDMISFGSATIMGCGFAGTYFNTDLAQAGGLNLNVEAKPARWMRIVAGYAYDDSLVIKAPNAFDPATIPGNRLLRRPLNSGSLIATAAYHRWNLSVMGYYGGSRTDSDFLGLGLTRTPPYARFDVAGGYVLGRGVELYGRVQNLLDRQYQLILGFPALGREFRGGVKYRIGGCS